MFAIVVIIFVVILVKKSGKKRSQNPSTDSDLADVNSLSMFNYGDAGASNHHSSISHDCGIGHIDSGVSGSDCGGGHD